MNWFFCQFLFNGGERKVSAATEARGFNETLIKSEREREIEREREKESEKARCTKWNLNQFLISLHLIALQEKLLLSDNSIKSLNCFDAAETFCSSRWVGSTFSPSLHFPLRSAVDKPQQHRQFFPLNHFQECWDSTPGQKGPETRMPTIVLCCPLTQLKLYLGNRSQLAFRVFPDSPAAVVAAAACLSCRTSDQVSCRQGSCRVSQLSLCWGHRQSWRSGWRRWAASGWSWSPRSRQCCRDDLKQLKF